MRVRVILMALLSAAGACAPAAAQSISPADLQKLIARGDALVVLDASRLPDRWSAPRGANTKIILIRIWVAYVEGGFPAWGNTQGKLGMHLTARLHWISSRITAGSVAYQLFAALCMSFAFAVAAHAQTNITAPITVNTVWRAGDGPFVLSGDVRVQNGASLTIEPGTVLYMGAGSALTVQAGTLVVDGTAAQRVTITSRNVQLGQTPAKGDWAGLRFLSGASQSRLSYVDIEFGSGIAVNGARLTLQNTRLRSHAGSAIAIDLASSLDGGENEATDNDINAIAVPAGDILGSVSWSLRGIPFLIGSGAVGVGASPRISSVTPATIAQGAARSVTDRRLASSRRDSPDARCCRFDRSSRRRWDRYAARNSNDGDRRHAAWCNVVIAADGRG